MFVAEILKTKGNAVYSITADVTVAQACQALDAKRVGALVSRTETPSWASFRNGMWSRPWRPTAQTPSPDPFRTI